MTNNQSVIRDAILIMLDENGGEIQGTDELQRRLNVSRKSYLIKCVRVIERSGKLTIISSRGGRGNRTIYKRNRNSPGQSRKRARV